MNLYYHQSPLGNFGDDLNTWIWDELLPGWRGWDPDRVLIGVGTLLGSSLLAATRVRPGVTWWPGRASATETAGCRTCRTVRDGTCAPCEDLIAPASLGLSEDLGILDPATMIADLPSFQGLPRSAVQFSCLTKARSIAMIGPPPALRPESNSSLPAATQSTS